MIFVFSYSTPQEFRSSLSVNFASCVIDVNMDALTTMNPSMHAWLSRLNQSDTVDLADYDESTRMYEAVVHDARTGESGCIKAVFAQKVNIYTEVRRAHTDIEAMWANAR